MIEALEDIEIQTVEEELSRYYSPEPEIESKMPMISPDDKSAPKFKASDPSELLRFIDRMEDLYEKHDVDSESDKIKTLGKFASAQAEREWKAFPSYKKDVWKNFKRDVIDSYPEAARMERGSLTALTKLCKKYSGDNQIETDDRAELAALIRAFRAEAEKLTEPPAIISNRDLVVKFLGCLDAGFADRVDNRLEMQPERPAASQPAIPAAIAAARDSIRGEDRYTLEEVIETAELVSDRAVLRGGVLGRGGASVQRSDSESSKGMGRENITVKIEESVAQLADTIINNEKTRTMEYKQFQEAQMKTMREFQNMMMNTVRQTQSMNSYVQAPAPRTYQSRPEASFPIRNNMGGANNGCYYCHEDGHRLNDCSHAHLHLDKKWIIRTDTGHLRLPNNTVIRLTEGKSMKEMVEQINGVAVNLNLGSSGSVSTFLQEEENVFEQQRTRLSDELLLSQNLSKLAGRFGMEAMDRVWNSRNQYIYTEPPEPTMDHF